MTKKTTITIMTISIILAGCSGMPSLEELRAPLILPAEVSPYYAIAFFRLAVVVGDYEAAFDMLTEKSKQEIGYTRFWALMKFNLSFRIAETDLNAFDFIADCKTIALIERDDPDCVDIGVEWKNLTVFVLLKREKGEWKIGFFETAVEY